MLSSEKPAEAYYQQSSQPASYAPQPEPGTRPPSAVSQQLLLQLSPPGPSLTDVPFELPRRPPLFPPDDGDVMLVGEAAEGEGWGWGWGWGGGGIRAGPSPIPARRLALVFAALRMAPFPALGPTAIVSDPFFRLSANHNKTKKGKRRFCQTGTSALSK